jgi:hypothetical protein
MPNALAAAGFPLPQPPRLGLWLVRLPPRGGGRARGERQGGEIGEGSVHGLFSAVASHCAGQLARNLASREHEEDIAIVREARFWATISDELGKKEA